MSQLTPTQRWATVILIAVFIALFLTFGLPVMAYRVAIALARGHYDGQAMNVERQLDTLSATSNAFRMVSGKVRPAVVHVNVFESHLRYSASAIDGEPANPLLYRYLREAGSGVIIDAQGYVITNHHVVNGASGIEVRLANGTRFDAKVLGSDSRLDLALLKVEPGTTELTAATLAESKNQEVGDWVLAIGNPFGLDQSVTAGIISALGRRDLLENFDGEDLVQTDAAINPGNSGGPLVNLKGQVIGINTFIIGEGNLGIGFAIPSNTVKRAFKDFRDLGQIRRGWLGLLMHEVVPVDERAKSENELWMQIDYCIPGSPAAKGGLKPGDVITRIDDQSFRSTREMRQIIERKEPDKTQTLLVIRGERKLEIPLIVQVTPKNPRVLPGEQEWGISVAYNIAPELVRQLGLPGLEGILVEVVSPRGAAAGQLRPGDLIVAVNDVRTATIAAFAEEISKIKSGERAILAVYSGSTPRTVRLEMPAK